MSEIINLNTSNSNQDMTGAQETEAPVPVSETAPLESEVRETTDLTNSSNPLIRKSKIVKKPDTLSKRNFKEFKTIEHLKDYKLYTEGKSKVLNIAAVRVIHTNIKPTVDNIRQSRVLLSTRFLSNIIDRATLSMLLLTERILPSMKTSGTKEITHTIVKPVTVPIRLAVEVGNAAIEAGTYFIYRPYHNELIRFRHFYNRKLINTKNKPLIRGSIDPVIKPLNDNVENIIKGQFPDLLTKQRKEFCCETSRSTMLIYVATEGSKLATIEHMKHKMMMPCNMVRRSNEILNEHLDKQEDLGMRSVLKAVDGAFKQMERETIEYLRNMMRPRRLRKKSVKIAVDGEPINGDSEFHILPINEEDQSRDQHSAVVEGV